MRWDALVPNWRRAPPSSTDGNGGIIIQLVTAAPFFTRVAAEHAAAAGMGGMEVEDAVAAAEADVEVVAAGVKSSD